MKEIEIVMAGAFGQIISGPYTEPGQAEQVQKETNALLADKLDRAVVVKVKRLTPKEIADSLNEVSIADGSMLFAEQVDDEVTPVSDPFIAKDGADDTWNGNG